MTTHLQQLLRNLCWGTEWNYAVFWKLKHLDRMVLTLEDGYYNSQNTLNPSESKTFSEILDGLQDGNFAHDSLSLAVAKMCYHVYSLGEGIVGQVAVAGKHQWIFAVEHAIDSYSSLELCNGWQAQFAAGIKTIAVAAVVPHGVVQFGSLNKVTENLQFLDHIRDVFSSFQDSICQIPTPVQCSMQNILQMKNLGYLPASMPNSSGHLDEAVGLISKDGLSDSIGNAKLVQAVPEIMQGCNTTITQNTGANDKRQICYPSQSCVTENTTLYDGKLSMMTLPEYNWPETSGNINSSFMFSAGTELHEALGPAFLKQCYPSPCDMEKRDDNSTSQIPVAMENSILTSDSGKDHLLEAVVANFCRRDALKKSKSFSTSDSMLTSERMPESSINTSRTIGSSCYSLGCSSLIEESTQNCLNSSSSYSIRSSTSECKVEPGKTNKKRARPGENSRPRPRDRQLIQDRIKELRELVPNGSKCSIDSLLERTIKHMGFMQNVTKHSDKLIDCAKSKGCSDMGVLGSGSEQGSSWAVEVGGHMKICPILVENLSMNGQMLIEMLCDDCDHFLEITEVIRSLGLTILKGITDSHGDKTWMRFVVEGQNNRNLHRMDVLWSLVQILQSKTTGCEKTIAS